VHYWAARVQSVDELAVPNDEIDAVSWLPAARAVEKVSYAHDHGVLAEFAARPAGTVPLILLRHAKALNKHGWAHDDVIRPLENSGQADAQAVADLLTCFAPRLRLVSSTALRCLDTLRPLAEVTGVPVRQEPALYIHNQSSRTVPDDPGTSLTAIVREALATGEPAVLCAHRENIPTLRAAALAALGGRVELPRDWDDQLSTSGFWVLNVAPPASPSPAQRWPGARPGSSGGTKLAPAHVTDLLSSPLGTLISADRYELSEP
jgi:phosphohistidine phosphatase SixA